MTLITELREHKTYNVPQQKDSDDKLDNELHQLREDLGFVMHKKTVSWKRLDRGLSEFDNDPKNLCTVTNSKL